jgi:hypothetical protein
MRMIEALRLNALEKRKKSKLWADPDQLLWNKPFSWSCEYHQHALDSFLKVPTTKKGLVFRVSFLYFFRVFSSLFQNLHVFFQF